MKLEDLIHYINKIEQIKSRIEYKHLNNKNYNHVCEQNNIPRLYIGDVWTYRNNRICITGVDWKWDGYTAEYVEVE